MAIPVINPTTSILAYKQWEVWAYQPYATNSPTSWSSGPLPPGFTLNATTGKISGRGEVPGVYLVELIATNDDGASAPIVLTIGIEPASVTPDSKHEVAIDLGSGQVSLLNYSVQSTTQQSSDAPLLSIKEDDDLLLRILFLKGGNVIDLDLTSLKFAVKELEPESVLVLSTPTFEKQGTGSNAGFLLHVRFDGDLLASSLSDYEEDGGTFFDALAEIEWVQTNTETIGPVELRRSSATFRIRIERDLIPGTMAWSLDWFAASELARQGKSIRRVGWTNRWLVYYRGLWWIRSTTGTRVVEAMDFGRDEFLARDWTNEAVGANPCGALPAYHRSAPSYRDWGMAIIVPPPIPGFSEP